MIDNLLDCSLGGLVLATMRGTFDSILILAIPIDYCTSATCRCEISP